MTEAAEDQVHTAVERLSPKTDDYTEILYHWQRYLVAARLAAGKQIADVACGEGYGADHLAAVAARVCALDIDATTLKQARARYRRPNLSFQQGSADRLPFASSAFDLVTSFETIEHLVPERQEPFLRELKRVLRPGGVLLMSTPNKRRTEKFATKNPYHFREFYLEEFVAFLKGQFEHVECWVQEINLAALSWRPGSPAKEAGWNTLRWRDGVYRPSDDAVDDFLYVVAICSDHPDNVAADLRSACFEVGRKPLESLWHDYLTQLDDLRGRARELETHVKRVESSLAVARFEHQAMTAQKDATIAHLNEQMAAMREELAGIRSSRSWRLLHGYQHVMDESLVGRVLTPIRDRVFKRRKLTS